MTIMYVNISSPGNTYKPNSSSLYSKKVGNGEGLESEDWREI